MARKLAIAGAILVSLSVSGSAGAAKVTVDDLMKLRSIMDVRISPDGTQVAYAVSTPSLERNAHEAAVFVVAAQGGEPRRLAEKTRVFAPRVPVPKLRWAPDGKSVSFLGLSGERPQVFVVAVAVAGGEAHAVTTAPEGVSNYEWSPDGRSIAYLMRDPASAEEQRQRKDNSFVIHAGAPDPATRLWLQPPDGAPARALTPLSLYVDSFAWAPDGSEIVYGAAPISGFAAQYAGRLYAVPAVGGEPRKVVDRPGMNTSPQYSPDGKRIAFVSTNGRAELMASRSLAVVEVRGTAAPRLYDLKDAWVSDFVWARDSRSVYLLCNDGLFARGREMFDQPLVRVSIDSGKAERIAGGANFTPSLARDGARLAYKNVAGSSMGDVVVRDINSGKVERLTEVNPELRNLEVGEMKAVSWRSFDGMEIWGLLLTPPHWRPGRKVPLLVYCHGGPGGGVTYGLFPQFMQTVGQVDPYGTEAMASAGFAVLFPMPRGGGGYGEAGQRAIVNSWGEGDYKDIMAGVDDLIAKGIADPDRLGVMGASYGGFLTNWIVTQTGRFKAASAAASIADLADQYYLSDGGDFIAEYFRKPWEARDSYLAHSPITFAQNVTTPLLIQHGERDLRVPIANAWKFYRALKALGKTVELDIYPRSSHLYYEPMLEREAMKRNLEWFTRWIEPAR
jgi:dipeptidyl aminopeptidase/acylaminoacyl peptidase